jgi:tetratricopeptide (TPR) repeat protein
LARKATAAREQEHTEDAITYYQKALALRPEWAEGWWCLGTLYAASDQHSDAVAAFHRVVAAQPQFGPAWASLGLSEYQANDFQSSFDSLLRARQLGLDAAPQLEKAAAYHLAVLFNLNGRFEDAWELLAGQVSQTNTTASLKTALALAMLRIPLLPEQVSPAKDGLLDMAGETAISLASGHFDESLQLFQRMLRDYPDTPFLHYAYGSALDFRQKYDEAAKQLREQIRLTPDSAVAHLRLGAVLLKSHHPAEALPVAQRATQLDPTSPISHQLVGRILAELGRGDEAARELDLAQKSGTPKYDVDSAVAAAYQSPSAPNVLAALRSKYSPGSDSSTTGGSSKPDFAELAEKAHGEGQTAAAISNYFAALEQNPTWEVGWNSVGVQLYSSGHFADAASALAASLSLNRSRADAWVFLGLSEFETKDYQNSFLHLERGRQLGFHGTSEAQKIASYCLAQLRNLNRDFDGAADLLTSSIEPDKLTPSMKVVLGASLLRMAVVTSQVPQSAIPLLQSAGETSSLLHQQKYDETFRRFDQLLKDYPQTPFLHYAYGTALQTFSRFDEAQQQFEQETKIAPQSPLPYIRMASVASTLHHPEDAVVFAQHALSLDPGAAGAHELLGRAFLDLGKVDDSVRELETASRLAPSYPEVHFDLARAYAKAKMPDKAESERAIFAEMSATTEQASVQRGNSAYGSPHDSSNLEQPAAKRGSNPQ